jgi:hypothetical protein
MSDDFKAGFLIGMTFGLHVDPTKYETLYRRLAKAWAFDEDAWKLDEDAKAAITAAAK